MNYKIELADGTEIKGLSMNGNNFIANRAIPAEVWGGDNLKSVTVIDPEGNEEVMEDAYLIHVTKYGKEHWFAIGEKTAAMKLQDVIGRLQGENADLEGAILELSMIISVMMIGGMD